MDQIAIELNASGLILRIPAMSIVRSDGMSITIPGDVDNALGAKRRR
jgi:hypothetical protein